MTREQYLSAVYRLQSFTDSEIPENLLEFGTWALKIFSDFRNRIRISHKNEIEFLQRKNDPFGKSLDFSERQLQAIAACPLLKS